MRILNFYIFSKNIKDHLLFYPTPINLNYFWSFGSLLGFCLVFQLITGFLLTFYYTPDIELAYYCVEYLMRYLKYGWFLRYFHINGASIFFILLYLHMAKGLFYKSYYKKSLWITGVILWLFLILISFLGYVLPWGQMSYWGLVVITNIVTVVPLAGQFILHCIWGGPHISTMTLMRIYCVHFILPFLFSIIALIHIIILHIEGSSSPIGIENSDNLYFVPYFYVKDLFGFFFIFMFLYIYLVIFNPNYLGETLNYVEVDYEKTPMHIVPEWYFLFVYGMLRCIPRKTPGILISFGAIFIFFILPYYPFSKIPAKFDLWHKFFLSIFFCSAINISFLATFSMTYGVILVSQIFTFFYFFYFILILFNLIIEEVVLQEYDKYSDSNYRYVTQNLFIPYRITEDFYNK